MTHDPFDESIHGLRDSYHAPPETPRDEMWSVIARRTREEAAYASVVSIERPGARRRHGSRGTWMRWVAAAAAVLVLGIGIGRLSVEPGAMETAEVGTPGAAPERDPRPPGPDETPPPERARPDGVEAGPLPGGDVPARAPSGTAAFRFAAVEHLVRSESLLTMVRTDARTGRYDAAVTAWADRMLVETRLLIDSPASDDPAIGGLLEDLELILVQLARLQAGDATSGPRTKEELELITRGMDRQDMLLRLQAMALGPRTLAGA